MITLNQSMVIKQNYVIRLLIALLFILKLKIFFKDISNDVEVWYNTSNYDENDKRPPPICKNKKIIGLFKDKLGGRIMKEFCALRAKIYSYLMDDNSEVNKPKETRNCVIKR